MVWPKGKKKGKASEETRKKMSLSQKRYFSNPKAREKNSRAIKKYYREHPEYIKKIDKAVTRWWHEHKNIRKEKSIEAKNLFLKHPERFKSFMKYGKNSNSPRFKTKQGFKVRSRGEQAIANFLHDNKISSFYESKTLFFEKEGQICIPDFYLPKYKTYIEFYGGHPGSYKKKVMKNKLYKKYKIKCIFITPSELGDLGYWLRGKLGK